MNNNNFLITFKCCRVINYPTNPFSKMKCCVNIKSLDQGLFISFFAVLTVFATQFYPFQGKSPLNNRREHSFI